MPWRRAVKARAARAIAPVAARPHASRQRDVTSDCWRKEDGYRSIGDVYGAAAGSIHTIPSARSTTCSTFLDHSSNTHTGLTPGSFRRSAFVMRPTSWIAAIIEDSARTVGGEDTYFVDLAPARSRSNFNVQEQETDRK
jgi:hypothetical protein